MGVITTAYSIPPKMMRKVRADNENLAYVFGDCEEEGERWEVESYDFDTGIEVYIRIFREAGYIKTSKNIDCEYADLDAFDYNGYDLWTISPSQVKAMVKELENATFEVIKAKNIGDQITDRRGYVLVESLFESYLSSIEGIKKFFNNVVNQGNYLLFAEA